VLYRKIPEQIDAGERHFRSAKSKKASIIAAFFAQHVAVGGACLQQAIAKNASDEILLGNQLVTRQVRSEGGNPAGGFGAPQIWPHLPAFVLGSLLRLAAIAIRASRSRSC
jgi:hypothetical protein